MQKLKLRYILEITTNATGQVPIPHTGRKRKYWYKKKNITKFMKYVKKPRNIGFPGNLETDKPDKELYTIKEKVCKIHTLPGKHKVIYSYDKKRNSYKYLITNELTWEGIKVVKEFFRNVKQHLNMEGACVRSEQGVAIKLLLLTCIDSLIHMKIAKLVSGNSQSGALTFQSIIRLASYENAENFVTLIKSPGGKEFQNRWLEQIKTDAIRRRKYKSEVDYFDQVS